MHIHRSSSRRSRGFTLIEMLAVLVIIGILLAFLAPTLLGGSASAKAEALDKQATNLSNNLGLLAGACGVSTAVAGNPLPATGSQLMDVLMQGKSVAAAAYTACFDTSDTKPMGKDFTNTGTGWSLMGFPVTLAGGGTSPVQVQYASVPDSITLKIEERHNSSLTALAASDTTDPFLQYSTAAADGTRTVTFFEPQ